MAQEKTSLRRKYEELEKNRGGNKNKLSDNKLTTKSKGTN